MSVNIANYVRSRVLEINYTYEGKYSKNTDKFPILAKAMKCNI